MKSRVQMNPETIERRARERAAARAQQHADLVARLRAKARAEGPSSIWQELLDEALEGA